MFKLALPWVLLCFPVPFLIWFLMPRARLQLATALKVPFFSAMAGIVDPKKRALSQQKTIALFCLIWFLVLFALSGPRWVGPPIPLTRESYNIMLALDLSGSMEVPDMMLHGRPASRLSVVKQAAIQFVNDRLGDKIGLIVFGSRAYLQTPLTYDRPNVLMRINDATVGLAGKTTAIGDALGLAIKRLQAVPKQGRVIILLTDGVNNAGVLEPLKAAELARSDNIKIYTIGLGSEEAPRDFGGVFMNLSADLDEETLKKVAQMTAGRYFRATDMQSLQTIYQTINQMEKVSQDQATIRPQHEYYIWPLALAFGLLLYWFSAHAGLLTWVTHRRRRIE